MDPGIIAAPVALTAERPRLTVAAAELADKFEIPLLRPDQAEPRFMLILREEGLELREREEDGVLPLRIDFLSGYHRYRKRHGGGRSQALARAAGLKRRSTPTVVDATAGLGKDSFVLATLGCKVVMCERSSVVAALLQDALRRAGENPEIGDWIKCRLRLEYGDSVASMPRLAALKPPEVIYLDPMYPRRSKSALVKREIRTVQALVGFDCNAPQLLDQALRFTGNRVVVKRPANGPELEGPRPSHAIYSTNTRYDVYLR